MAVAIVTDSAAALPEELVEDLGIGVVPLRLRVGDEDMSDGELPLDELMAMPAETVTTSGATPSAFLEAIDEARARPGPEPVDSVLVLTIAASMSSTFEAARLAAEQGGEEIPVRVLDTRTAAGAEGLVVVHAAEVARSGADLDEVEAAARTAAGEVRLAATVDSLDRLIASGRVSGIAGRAGRRMNVNPMFEFRDGSVHASRPAFTRDAALDRILARWRRSRVPDAKLHVAALHALDHEAGEQLLKRVIAETEPATAFVGSFSSVMVAHTGGGLVGLAWWWEPLDQAERTAVSAA
ncbi:MAG TPA: DegV family protein [Acidimicrobiia bacterium]